MNELLALVGELSFFRSTTIGKTIKEEKPMHSTRTDEVEPGAQGTATPEPKTEPEGPQGPEGTDPAAPAADADKSE